MLKGFKDFLMRGNVVDLAVAVVVGSAFTALVTTFTNSIIKPVIASTGGSNEVNGLSIAIRPGDPESVIDFAAVINAVITFLLTAAVVYFVFVAPLQKLRELRKKGQEEAADPTETELLTEIRDLLRQQQGVIPTQQAPAETEKASTAASDAAR